MSLLQTHGDLAHTPSTRPCLVHNFCDPPQVAWANWNDVFDEEFDADEDLGCVPKLYVADSGTGNVVLSYVGHIQRTCLVSEVRGHGHVFVCCVRQCPLVWWITTS